MPGALHVHVVEGTRLRVVVTSDQDITLALIGDLTDMEPEVDDGGVLELNPALRSNLWAYAKTWYAARATTNADALAIADPLEQKAALKLIDETRKTAQKRADAYGKVAQWIADVADDLSTEDIQQAWCSSCFLLTEHRRSNRPAGQMPVYVCQGCGSPTLPCVAVGCSNMAVRDRGAIRIPQFCAEHKHAIPGFEKAREWNGELHDYEEFLQYEKPDLDKASKIAVGSALAVGLAIPLAFLAAPAIGGAIGSLGMFGGFSGAVATSHGLALLGGGSIAAGGLGMAGGTAVVTAVGAAVGGALGASVSNAYVREDKSFHIELLRPGKGGVPVLVTNGFLTDGRDDKWGGWKKIVNDRYPDSPVYRVHWGAKELRDFGILGAGALGKAGGVAAAKLAAATATKAGAKFLGNVIGPAVIATDLAKNPWYIAKSRADKTGVIVGDILGRTNAESYVLIGHSLGARVMAVAAETLGTKPDGPRIDSVHLLGAAMGAKGQWESLSAAVEDAVYCYHSKNDDVLKLIYTAAQGGQSAAGLTGLSPITDERIRNVDVGESVKSHFQYQDKVTLL